MDPHLFCSMDGDYAWISKVTRSKWVIRRRPITLDGSGIQETVAAPTGGR